MAGVRRADDGFTLIEIMVVVTIIGIMTGLIAINVITQDPQKDLNKEAQRFLAVMQMAQEEALFSQQEIGVIVTEEGYRFARWGVPAQPEESAMTTTDPALSGRDEDPDAATNAAYHAKATLQLSRLFIGDGRLGQAKALLDSLLQEANIDQVYQALALAQLCQVLDKLGRAEEFAESRREFQTMYGELQINNPAAERLIDQTLNTEMRLTLGIDDS